MIAAKTRAKLLRQHQSGIMTTRLEPATEMMSADAGLDPDQAIRQISKP
jgi:hypothetical protein